MPLSAKCFPGQLRHKHADDLKSRFILLLIQHMFTNIPEKGKPLNDAKWLKDNRTDLKRKDLQVNNQSKVPIPLMVHQVENGKSSKRTRC